jgi:23S rRNA (cytidine1920-2'-O)/16S rRNA (cytidine1409-2'-O)-methyltransferase
VKPQFEVGKDAVGKGGVVRDPALHREVLARITAFLAHSGASVLALAPSPILGAEGNREFFVHARCRAAGPREDEVAAAIERVLAENPS